MVDPIFIFSLPRTGSTFLQRILASHEKISSFAEPHFLLPIIGMLKKEGTLSANSHQSTYKGVKDIVDGLPNGEVDFYKFINSFSGQIYSSLSDNRSIYFLDKTPRYISVIEELAQIFPNGKFIFLFRSPIQVFSSIVSTFCNGKFSRLYGFNKFLYEDFESLSKNYEKLKDRSISVNYEEFLKNPEQELRKVLKYLNIESDMSILEKFSSVNLVGQSVDPTGTKKYMELSLAPITKWKEVINSGYRNHVVRKYIEKLDERSLEIQGYNKADLIEQLESNKRNYKPSDLVDFFDFHRSNLVRKLNLNLYFDKKLSWSKEAYLS